MAQEAVALADVLTVHPSAEMKSTQAAKGEDERNHAGIEEEGASLAHCWHAYHLGRRNRREGKAHVGPGPWDWTGMTEYTLLGESGRGATGVGIPDCRDLPSLMLPAPVELEAGEERAESRRRDDT